MTNTPEPTVSLDGPSPRPTREQVEAGLVVAEQPFLYDRSTNAGALLRLAAEVRAQRAELDRVHQYGLDLGLRPAPHVRLDVAAVLSHARDLLAARTPQPAECVCVGDTCEMSGCDVPSCREPEGDCPAWHDASARLPAAPVDGVASTVPADQMELVAYALTPDVWWDPSDDCVVTAAPVRRPTEYPAAPHLQLLQAQDARSDAARALLLAALHQASTEETS